MSELDRGSAGRFERARVCFASSNWPAVLEALSSDLPPTLAIPCIAMRAHALEALGNVEAAVGSLMLVMGTSDEAGRRALTSTMVQYTSSGFCRQSYLIALARFVSSNSAPGRSGVGRFKPGCAIFTASMLLCGVACFVVLPWLLSVPLTQPSYAADRIVMAGIFFVAFGLPFPFMFLSRFIGRDTKRVLCSGRPAKAQVLAVTDGGVWVGKHKRLIYLKLAVYEGIHSPYEASAAMLLGRASQGLVEPGVVLPVRVDPERQGKAELDLGWRI